MILVSRYTLQERLIDYFGYIPEGFLDHLPKGKYLIYLSSCVENTLVFMEPSPERFTGFTREEIIAGGLDLQISRIHPEDLQGIYDNATRVLKMNETAIEQGKDPSPLVMEYRMQHADGAWKHIRETRIYRYFGDGSRDRLLGKMVDISMTRRSDIPKFVEDAGKEYPFLQSLRKFKKGGENRSASTGISLLTIREKEILQLIGSGLSTKQIAAQLFISINTVQTHRTHLLKKLQVKNSMELIREASKAFWL